MSSSTWKLVEAETDTLQESSTDESRRGFKGGRRGGGRNGRGGRGRGDYQYRNADYYASLALQQIELIYSPDNLCMDTYIRQYMDVEGYVPIALVGNYPNVSCYGVPYDKLVAKLSESHILEVDNVNELVRLKSDWEKWLMPNYYGGRGQPKYLKQEYIEPQYEEIEANETNETMTLSEPSTTMS